MTTRKRCISEFDRLSAEATSGGTYATVFLARDKQHKEQQEVAIKALAAEGTQGSQSVLELLRNREVAILRKLDGHPNVIRLLDVAHPSLDRERGMLFLVFEAMQHDLRGLMENKTLSSFRTRGECKGWILQVMHGVAYCHSHGVIHRDIKPENMLMSSDGHIKVADFGLAREDDPRRYGRYTNPVVTQWYRAPELLLGAHRYSYAIDVWAVGVMAAEILANAPLFPAKHGELQTQLTLIWNVCGTPLENGWVNAQRLPQWLQLGPASSATPKVRNTRATFQTSENKNDSRRSYFSDGFLELFDALTQLDPERRTSLNDALRLPYLVSEAPRPHTSELMTRVPQSYFGKLKKRRKGSPAK